MNKERLLPVMRFWLERYHASYRDIPGRFRSGADAIDGECYRLIRLAFLSIYNGSTVQEACDRMVNEWLLFCKEQNRLIASAPKLKYGPTSGCSSIHYKHAEKGLADWMRGEVERTIHQLST
jgi:hypothetical protein